VNALLRSAMAFWMADAPEARRRCAALAGKCVVVELSDLGIIVALRPGDDGLSVALQDDPGAHARIRAPSLDLLRLSRGTGSGNATGKVHIEGDAELAQAIRDLLRDVPFDAEERLARMIGDVPAHGIGQIARGMKALARDTRHRVEHMVGEFLKHESRDLPRPDEVARFVAAVDALRDDVARAEARLQRIQDAG